VTPVPGRRGEQLIDANGAPAPRAVAPSPASLHGVEKQLFTEGYAFDFFQAVRLLERLDAEREPVGRDALPQHEAVRFRTHVSLSFPPSQIFDLVRQEVVAEPPLMTVTFLGLTGASGVLPRHYTELLLRLDRDVRGPERYLLRDWLDLFNHRLISLFYRAWEKYRFYVPYERGEYARSEPDTFTRALFSLVGLGMPPFRDRLRLTRTTEFEGFRKERTLGEVEDLVLLRYSGFLARRVHTAAGLEAMVRDYFTLPAQVGQFQGQWLHLDAQSQSRLGECGQSNRLGVDCVAGERVWDAPSKFRVRLGPLAYSEFEEFLPDREPVPERKSFFLLLQLVRLYVGAELDFDVQLLLSAGDVPESRLADGEHLGSRLGWNTWLRSQEFPAVAADAVFDGRDIVSLN
jgi:type VI secretion system protein ImpH